MEGKYNSIIHAIDNGFRYSDKDVRVVPSFTCFESTKPAYVYVKVGEYTLVMLSKRQKYICVHEIEGMNTRLVNAILKHFINGECKVSKRKGKYVLERRACAAVWTVDLY